MEAELSKGIVSAACNFLHSPSILTLHGITGTSAFRLLAPYLADGDCQQGLGHLLAAAGQLMQDTSPLELDSTAPDWASLAAAARENADEHVIKLVEACRREYELTDYPVFVAAARHVQGFTTGSWE